MSTPRGPRSGETPDDYGDLHTSDNPYSSGERIQNVSDVRPSAYPNLAGIAGSPTNPSVPGYFFNPPSDSNSVSVDGAGEYAPGERTVAGEIASGMDAAVQHAFDTYFASGVGRNSDGGDPSAVDFDEGYGTSGTGRS